MTDYTVQEGDTLWGIARQLGIPLGAIQEANQGINPRALKIGSTINLPSYDAFTAPQFAPDPNATSPFSIWSNPSSMAGVGTSWKPQPQLAAPNATPGQLASPDGVDAGLAAKPLAPIETPYQAGMPLEQASQKARNQFVDMGNDFLEGVKGQLKYPGELLSGERPFDINEAIPWAVDTAMMMVGGGATAGLRGRPNVRAADGAPSRNPQTPARPPFERPMELGPGQEWPRPFDFQGQHNLSARRSRTGGPPLLEGEALAQRRAYYDSPEFKAKAASTKAGEELHWKGLLESSHEQVTGVKPPRDYRKDFYLGAGTKDGKGTVVPFDPNAKHLTDPKTNLERRMARRGQGNEVKRFDEAQIDKYAAETRKDIEMMRDTQKDYKGERKSFAKGIPAKAEKRVREDVAKMTPEQWLDLKPETKWALRDAGIMPDFVRKGSKGEVMDLIDRLKNFDPTTEF